MPSPENDLVQNLELADETATERLGAVLAERLRPGDLVALAGPLGAGKTVLARAIIRALGSGEEVPSPTFSLLQTYETARGMIWHFDLYRLERPEDAVELGFEDALADGISLVEWPERLGRLLPAAALRIEIAPGGAPDRRRLSLAGAADWPQRLSTLTADV